MISPSYTCYKYIHTMYVYAHIHYVLTKFLKFVLQAADLVLEKGLVL